MLVIPFVVYVTRFTSLRLLEAGYAIPVAVVLGLAAVAFARKARREMALGLGKRGEREGTARAGRLLGMAGMCVAAASLVSLIVYELLQYKGRH